jgi:hypothetical protein
VKSPRKRRLHGGEEWQKGIESVERLATGGSSARHFGIQPSCLLHPRLFVEAGRGARSRICGAALGPPAGVPKQS